MFFINVIKGALMGLGGILPGVSGGMMAVSFGLYKPMLNALSTITRDFLAKLRFLLPIALGGVAGFILGALLLDKTFATYETAFIYAFVGLIAGGIPDYVKKAGDGKFKAWWLIFLLCGAVIAYLAHILPGGSKSEVVMNNLYYVLAGAIVAFGSIVPGLSTAFILIELGWYGSVMHAISSFQIVPLLCLIVGAAGCAVLTVKLMNKLFSRYCAPASYCVLGFLIVSAVFIFPTPTLSWSQALYVALFVAGAFLGFFMDRLLSLLIKHKDYEGGNAA